MDDAVPVSAKPVCTRDDAIAVLARLREAGHVACFAGGCVRDELMGLTPKDYDIATDAPPDRVRQLFARTQAVGAAFGVILVRQRQSVVEVATFRAEGKYLDGRHPSGVRFTSAEEDAKRRDFTINGLFLDPITNQVIDYVGGREDLAARRLRAIGDPGERFAEDHLRLLRAARFAARFGLTIDRATADAIRKNAPTLKRISPERIAEELRLMLVPPTRAVAWPLLWEFGLVHEIFRFLPPGTQAPATLNPASSIFLLLAPARPIPFGLALAAATLCHRWQQAGASGDLRTFLTRQALQEAAKAIRTALRVSNEESDQMHDTLAGVALMLDDIAPTIAAKKRFLARPTSRLSRDLLDAIASIGSFVDRIGALRPELSQLEKTAFAPAPLLTGDDLMAAGLAPGPVFKRVLDAVYDAQLEDRVRTRDDALALALDLGKRK